MTVPRRVVITGASRGLGLASAVHLHRRGWHVVGAMRSVDSGMDSLRRATGAAAGDHRLTGVALDLTDPESIDKAAAAILAEGAPFGLVHNAGISAAGMLEETPMEVWEQMLATSILGPVRLTRAVLPAMRSAGAGRIVLVSSQGGVRGMPATAAYSIAKSAAERLGESLAGEVAPFGVGVSVLITGTYDTDIITDAGATDCRDMTGPYARHHATMDTRGRTAMKMAARAPAKFAVGLEKALASTKPYERRPVGPDARMLMLANRVLPPAAMHHLVRLMMGIPRFGALSSTEGRP